MELETERLVIRKAKESDAKALFSHYCGDLLASTYLARPPHDSVDVTLACIKKWRKNENKMDSNTMVLVVEDKRYQEAIGCLVIKFDGGIVEIHFGIAASLSGQGLATELCLAVVNKLSLDKLITKIWTYPHIENRASIKVLEKCGFEKKRILKNWLVFPNLSDAKQDCLEFVYCC